MRDRGSRVRSSSRCFVLSGRRGDAEQESFGRRWNGAEGFCRAYGTEACAGVFPALETLGYFQTVPTGRRERRRRGCPCRAKSTPRGVTSPSWRDGLSRRGGSTDVLLRPAGAVVLRSNRLPRAPLRSARGYSPSPRRGEWPGFARVSGSRRLVVLHKSRHPRSFSGRARGRAVAQSEGGQRQERLFRHDPGSSRDESLEGFSQFGQELSWIATAGRIEDAVLHVVGQEQLGRPIQCGADRGHLHQDVGTGLVLFDHSPDGPDVSFDTCQPRQDIPRLFVLRHRRLPYPPRGDMRYCILAALRGQTRPSIVRSGITSLCTG